jgi:hypothetical protein
MKQIRYMMLILCVWGLNALAGVYVTDTLIKKASTEMTTNEVERVKTNIRDGIAAAKAAGDPVKLARYQDAAKDFSNGKYDLVLQNLASLGENIKHLLHITELRNRQLAGALDKAPLPAREVAALDLFFANDAKESTKTWPNDTDKALYLLTIAAKIGRTKLLIIDVPLLETVINDLSERLDELKNSITDNAVRLKVRRGLAELEALKKIPTVGILQGV